MCLLFVFVNPLAKKGEYKLVVVNNRDETYDRPSKPAHFWESKILGGMDITKGREGGTWLAVNDSAKIACLLNIFESKKDSLRVAAPRGKLVVDFLLAGFSASEYMDGIKNSEVDYKPFHLITMEPKDNSYSITCYNSQEQIQQVFRPGFYGFGNCPLDKPYKKIVKGKNNFQKVVEEHGKVETEECLINELVSMMKDSEPNFPDDQLSKQGQGYDESFIRELSSIQVTSPSFRYGTRTTTVILVDHDDRVVFKEQTMKEPINLENVEWQVNKYTFRTKTESA